MANNETQHIYSAEYEGGSSAVPATSVIYDNTTSGLDAVTAQAAIDEIEAQIDALAAEDVASTGIGDTTDVQGALDYIMSVKIDGAYNNAVSGLSATTIQGAIDEVADDVSNLEGYTVKTIETVTLPNCTTYPSIVEHIKSDIEAIIAAQPNNEKLAILGLSIDGFGFFSYYGSRSLWANNTSTTYLGTMFTRTRNDASTVVIESMSGTGCKRATIGDSTFVTKDFVVDEPTTTLVVRVQVLRLKSV